MTDERLHSVRMNADDWREKVSRLGNKKHDAETAKTGVVILAGVVKTLVNEMERQNHTAETYERYKRGVEYIEKHCNNAEMECDKRYCKDRCPNEEQYRKLKKLGSVVTCDEYAKAKDKTEYEKPPMGIKPRWLIDESRLVDIINAMGRFIEAKKTYTY